jgi:hypothetical protein
MLTPLLALAGCPMTGCTALLDNDGEISIGIRADNFLVIRSHTEKNADAQATSSRAELKVDPLLMDWAFREDEDEPEGEGPITEVPEPPG